MRKSFHVIGGGTVSHIRPHLALCAPAYGKAAKQIHNKLMSRIDGSEAHINLYLTRMAGGNEIETTEDLKLLIDKLVSDKSTRAIFLTAAICDFDVERVDRSSAIGKKFSRLSSSSPCNLYLTPADKIVSNIRTDRKDIFLVACKTTSGESDEVLFNKAYSLMKRAHCNLVLANDIKRRQTFIVTPEGSTYGKGMDRDKVLDKLVDMSIARTQGEFSRTKVDGGDLLKLEDMPITFQNVLGHCLQNDAYKPFEGKTVGHYAHRPNKSAIMFSSRRGANYNEDPSLVTVEGNKDGIIAHGAKPSAGARSQYQLFKDHPEFDCVIHFHCPMKASPAHDIPIREQWRHECGSMQCGINTSKGITKFCEGRIGAVMLEKHGPNIMFKSDGNSQEVIDFINSNFDLKETVYA